MTTIAKTKRYKKLVVAHSRLVKMYSVMSELNLHINQGIDATTAQYYYIHIFDMGMAPDFFNMSLLSMRQIFYIELNGFIGCYWLQNKVNLRNNDSGSLAKYLYDGTQIKRKKTAKDKFEKLLQNHKEPIKKIHDLRTNLGHFVDLDVRNSTLLPSEIETRNILNDLAETLYLLGFHKLGYNTPHYVEEDGDITKSIQLVIDKVIYGYKQKSNMRKKYLNGRKKWFQIDAES